MKLFYSPTSPYARKVRVTLIEKGLESRVDIIASNPLDNPDTLQSANPLGKVPCLVTDDGLTLCDSPLICAYIDDLDGATRLAPQSDAQLWPMRAREALADGIMDAALNLVMEERRPEAQRSPLWQERWAKAIERTLTALENDSTAHIGALSPSQIALGCALGYLDFRLPDIMEWRSRFGGLAGWYDGFSRRDSMIATRPD